MFAQNLTPGIRPSRLPLGSLRYGRSPLIKIKGRIPPVAWACSFPNWKIFLFLLFLFLFPGLASCTSLLRHSMQNPVLCHSAHRVQEFLHLPSSNDQGATAFLKDSSEHKVHHFGVGNALWNELLYRFPNPSFEHFVDMLWDTNEQSLSRENWWLRSRDVDTAELSETAELSANSIQAPAQWSLKHLDQQFDTASFMYLELNDSQEIHSTLAELKVPQSKMFPERSAHSVEPFEEPSDIFALRPIALLSTQRVTFLDTGSVRLYIDTVEIARSKFSSVGGFYFRHFDDECKSIIAALQSSAGYFPSVRSKVMEYIHYRRPDIETKLPHVATSGFCEAHISSGAPSHLPPTRWLTTAEAINEIEKRYGPREQ